MFAKTLLHFENNVKKMLISKGSATNRSQNIVWIIFMPLIPVSDVSEEQTSEMTVLSAATSEKWTSFWAIAFRNYVQSLFSVHYDGTNCFLF